MEQVQLHGKHNVVWQGAEGGYVEAIMRNEHVWKETTEDGIKREIRATKFGGQWKLQSQEKGAEEWTYHDKPTLADLEALRDVIFRKYQRRRASYEDVQSVDALIKRAQGELK